MKVSKGLATWAGLVAAVGQYLAAVAVFLDDPDKATAAAPLATATATLLVVIAGRMGQAKSLASRPVTMQFPPAAQNVQSTSGTNLADPGEPGDPDSLPDRPSELAPPPDEGEAQEARS